jgi:TonB family protein
LSKRLLGFLLACFTGTCFGQVGEALCPRHIETPTYPPIARWTNLTGKVTLTLTIDADGKVTDAEAVTTESNVSGSKALEGGTVANIRRWTFAKPPSAPYQQRIVYDYEIDKSLPLDGPTTVTFDLPERVAIVTSGFSLQTTKADQR